jgi:hypothetical protein
MKTNRKFDKNIVSQIIRRGQCNMNCRQVKRNLAFFLENTLSAEERDEIANHFKDCPSCSHLVEEFTHRWEVLKQRDRIQSDPYLWIKLQRRIVDYDKDKNSAWGRFEGVIHWIRPAMAVIAVLICIFLGYSLGNIPRTINGQTTSPKTVRLTVLQNFFENHYYSPMNDLPTGSIEATYWNMMSQE